MANSVVKPTAHTSQRHIICREYCLYVSLITANLCIWNHSSFVCLPFVANCAVQLFIALKYIIYMWTGNSNTILLKSLRAFPVLNWSTLVDVLMLSVRLFHRGITESIVEGMKVRCSGGYYGYDCHRTHQQCIPVWHDLWQHEQLLWIIRIILTNVGRA